MIKLEGLILEENKQEVFKIIILKGFSSSTANPIKVELKSVI